MRNVMNAMVNEFDRVAKMTAKEVLEEATDFLTEDIVKMLTFLAFTTAIVTTIMLNLAMYTPKPTCDTCGTDLVVVDTDTRIGYSTIRGLYTYSVNEYGCPICD